MNSRIVIGLLGFIFVISNVAAQTQRGIVKTRGKMIDGKIKPGVGLGNATVQIKDRSSILSRSDGTFSFPARNQIYYLQSVKKNGYQLVDFEVCRNYKFSEEPLYIVMETPEQQKTDLIAAERKIRRNLQKLLQQREDEIESLNTSQQKKDSLLRILYNQQTSNEQLISDMAKRLAIQDYDQLDSFYRQVSCYIEKGELTRADSLLKTRGNVSAQVKAQLYRGQAIQEQKERLQKAGIVYRNDNEELSQRCFKYYETFRMNHQNDSAAYYLGLRASLDSTNVQRLSETGLLMEELFCYDQAIYYAQKTIKMVLDNNQLTDIAAYHYNLASALCRKGYFEDAINEYKIALNMWKGDEGENSVDVARCYNDLGYTYYTFDEKNKESFSYYEKALKIRMDFWGENHKEVAMTLNNMGIWYYSHNKLDSALSCFQKALDINFSLYGETHPDIATRYNNIGMIYDKQKNPMKAIDYYTKAIAILKKLYGERCPIIANTYSNLGLAYHNLGNYCEAIKYKAMSLEQMKFFLGDYHPNVAWTTNDLGYVYFDLKNYNEAIGYFTKAITIGNIVWKDKCPFKLSSMRMINISEYYKAIEEKDLSSFLLNHVFTANIVEGDTPARKLGLSGEYILLELEDWHQESLSSIFDKKEELQEKPKTIVIMKDGKFFKHHFVNTIGAEFGIKEISMEEKLRINQMYNNWKRQN